MSKIISQGHFTAIGMRAKIEDDDAIVINTCGNNDTRQRGTPNSWVWCNPTNRAIIHPYHDIQAVSVECLWQGTKIKPGMIGPDLECLGGEWRRGKGKRPVGAYAGLGQPLITSPGEARRAIYIPAFARLVNHWLQDSEVAEWVQQAKEYDGAIYLRDFDTGRGVDRDGPMSHAWLLCEFLNNGEWPK
jgi:hypothetical protein